MSFNKRFVVAQYDFESEKEGCLSIKANDRLVCLEVFEDGWIKARNQHGETGFVPADYVDGGPVVSGRRVVPSDSPTKESASGSSPLRGAGGGDYAAAGAGNPAMLAHSPGGAISPPPQIPENTAPAGGVGDTVSRKQYDNLEQLYDLLQHKCDRLQEALDLRGREIERLNEELDARDLEESKSPRKAAAASHARKPSPSSDSARASSPDDAEDYVQLQTDFRQLSSRHRRLEEELALKSEELVRVDMEVAAKDDLLETMQRTLMEKAEEADELVLEARNLACKTEEMLKAQLNEKDKQLDILQGLLDELTQEGELKRTVVTSEEGSVTRFDRAGSSAAAQPKDRAFFDEFLLSVLEQKDELTDQLHDLNAKLIETKAQLGSAEFEKERLLTQLRAHQRRSSNDARSPMAHTPSEEGSSDMSNYTSVTEGASLELASLLRERTDLIIKAKELEKSLDVAKAEIDNLNKELESKEQEEKRLKRKDSYHKSAAMRQVAELQTENERLEKKLKLLQDKDAKAREMARLEGLLADHEAELKALRAGSLAGTLDALQKRLARLEKEASAGNDVRDEMETLKGRIRNLQSGSENKGDKILSLQGQLEAANTSLAEKEAALQDLRSQLRALQDAVDEKDRRLAHLEREAKVMKDLLDEQSSQDAGAQAELDEVRKILKQKEAALTVAQDELVGKESKLAQSETAVKELRNKMTSQQATLESLRQQLDELNKEAETNLREKQRMLNLRTEMLGMEGKVAQAQLELAEAQRRAKLLSNQYNEERQRRRSLHNALMEICGNIRVHCRLRPILGQDRKANDTSVCIRPLDRMELEANQVGKDHKRKFEYDRVYAPQEGNQDVFREVAPMITSFIDGYNICITAYGQTGSGKTYTMLGPTGDDGIPSMTGIIPQSVSEVFRLIEEKEAESIFKVQVSVLEVYNEAIIDLLDPKRSKHDVTEGSGVAEVPTATQMEVENPHTVLDLVLRGMSNRVERKTDMNAHSSRSHLIVTVTVVNRPRDGRPTTCSRMHLVDLAGSECNKMSGATGDGLKEAKNINRSLASLSDVLLALGKKRSNSSQHVPYRNSRLTHILKDSIGGDAKMLMLLCVSTTSRCLTESLQTCRFGTRARQVQTGLAQKKVVSNKAGGPSKSQYASKEDGLKTMASAALGRLMDYRAPRGDDDGDADDDSAAAAADYEV